MELTAEETGREPPPEPGISDDPAAGIRADYAEKDLQNIVRKAGGVYIRYGNGSRIIIAYMNKINKIYSSRMPSAVWRGEKDSEEENGY